METRLAAVKGILGKPAWEGPGVLVYQGDCLELMRLLPAELVDLTITSPPYNIGKEYERPMDTESYLAWCEKWASEVHRLTRPAGAFWLNLGYIGLAGRAKAIPIPYVLWSRIRFFLVQEIVWNYGAGVAARPMFSPRNEKWLWYVKDPDRYTFNLDAVRDPNVKYPNQKKNGRIRVNRLGKNPTDVWDMPAEEPRGDACGDVWQVPKVTTGEGRTGRRASPERTAHPAQFPEAVVKRITLACSNPDDLLLDPFGGSGTTAAVAVANGRSCITFEMSAEYVGVAARRLDSLLRQRAVVQEALF